MSASPRSRSLLAGPLVVAALAASAPAPCGAQYRNDFDGPFSDMTDYQWFEPVDLDLDRLPVRRGSGWRFAYSKCYLAVTGERVPLGDPDAVTFSEVVFPGNTAAANAFAAGLPGFLLSLDDPRLADPLTGQPNLIPTDIAGGNPNLAISPDPYQIQNGISSAPPSTEAGWADRLELGYADDQGNGLMIGLLTGNKIESEETFGFELDDDGLTPNGFGSVHVNFSTSAPFLLVGFRDYGSLETFLEPGGDGGGVDGGVGPTQAGPGDDGTGGTDGEPDDILTNGDTFFFFDVDDDGEFDPVVDLLYVDFGDLQNFNIRFNQLEVRSVSRFQGLELMRTHELSNRHWMAKRQNQRLKLAYGLRLFEFNDEFLFDGESDVLGRTFSFTEAENQIVGPQVRAQWSIQRGKLNLAVDGRCLLGYNIQNLDQENGIGEGLVPGGLNSPLLLQPTYTRRGRTDRNFSPVVELRADAKYQLTRSVAVTMGYTGTFIDGISRASQLVEYTLPELGLGAGGDQHVFINGVNFGVEFLH